MQQLGASGRVAVKLCGLTSTGDADVARDIGADFVGVLVEVETSPRSVSRTQAIAMLEGGRGVALCYDAGVDLAAHLDRAVVLAAVQLCGTESTGEAERVAEAVSCPVWKSLHLVGGRSERDQVETALAAIDEYARAGVRAVVLDTAVVSDGAVRRGGTGVAHDWHAAARIVESSTLPVLLAGGLTPENVAQAVLVVQPAGVDVSSGIEVRPGVKDEGKMRRFIGAVRAISDESATPRIPEQG